MSPVIRVLRSERPVTKVEAAYRQLRQAIILFFDPERDLLAVHTLAAAAAELIRDLLRGTTRGVPSLPGNEGEGHSPLLAFTIIPGGKLRHDAINAFRDCQNFLKHADKDPERLHEFNGELTVLLLFAAVWEYGILVGRRFRAADAFLAWHRLAYPALFDKNDQVAASLLSAGLSPYDFGPFQDLARTADPGESPSPKDITDERGIHERLGDFLVSVASAFLKENPGA